MRIAGLYDLDHFGHRRRHVTIVGNAWRSFPFGTENSPNEKHLEMKQLPSKTGIMLTARTVTRRGGPTHRRALDTLKPRVSSRKKYPETEEPVSYGRHDYGSEESSLGKHGHCGQAG